MLCIADYPCNKAGYCTTMVALNGISCKKTHDKFKRNFDRNLDEVDLTSAELQIPLAETPGSISDSGRTATTKKKTLEQTDQKGRETRPVYAGAKEN